MIGEITKDQHFEENRHVFLKGLSFEENPIEKKINFSPFEEIQLQGKINFEAFEEPKIEKKSIIYDLEKRNINIYEEYLQQKLSYKEICNKYNIKKSSYYNIIKLMKCKIDKKNVT